MPWTRWMFLVASLALVGIFPFTGFFSKDSIIAATLNLGWYGWVFWVVALVGAFLTGLYTFRLYFIVFPGEPSAFVEEHHHDHHGLEGPWTMLVPVAVLTVLSAAGGWIQFAPKWHLLTDWLEPVARTLGVAEPTNRQEWISTGFALGLGLAGMAVAYAIYGARRVAVPRLPAVQRALEHKLYFDEAYDVLFYKPAVGAATLLRRAIEEPVVLTAAGTEFGEATMDVARGVRRLQTGMLRTYVLFLGAGMAVMAVVFLVVR
jgi:NADH-quinone oxidoreductase subunit L